MKKFKFIAAVLLIGFITFNSFAQNSNEHQGFELEKKFEKLDTNNDNRITKDEVNEKYLALFDFFDMNKDGFLTKEEIEAKKFERPTPKERFAIIDKNKDGKLSYAEIERREIEKLKERFKKMDRDNDGYLSLEEMPKKGKRNLKKIAKIGNEIRERKSGK